MKYERPHYKAPGIPTEKAKLLFSGIEVEVPKFTTPISPRENFKRAATRNDPLWIPNSLTDIQSIITQDLVTGSVRGMLVGSDFSRGASEDYVFTDWFNTSWTWVCSAGGAMLTPGTVLCEDITDWERVVKFPDIREWNFEACAANYYKNVRDPGKALHINMGTGMTERLISILGGYTEGLMALSIEPEAVRRFFDKFTEYFIDWFDMLLGLYPDLDMITYHDDWGTEKDTFFSPKMMEDLVFEPTKRIVEHVRSKNVLFEFHSCGNVTRFLPYFIDLNADFLQLQRRAIDTPAMKVKYGDEVGFSTGFEGVDPARIYPRDEMIKMVRNSVDTYGKRGGIYFRMTDKDPETLWNQVSELYAYSREFYDVEQGRA